MYMYKNMNKGTLLIIVELIKGRYSHKQLPVTRDITTLNVTQITSVSIHVLVSTYTGTTYQV